MDLCKYIWLAIHPVVSLYKGVNDTQWMLIFLDPLKDFAMFYTYTDVLYAPKWNTLFLFSKIFDGLNKG